MYKKALNSFFLKVHPDFFHHNSQQRTVNENAVAQLNELLGWAKEFKSGTLRPPPATTISLTFYRRFDEDEGAGAAGAEPPHSVSAQPRSVEDRAQRVQSTFALPDGFTPSEANRGLVERAVNKFLRDLLRRANCIDSVTESISEADDVTAARREARPLRQRRNPRLRAQERKQPKSLLDEAMESMTLQWTLTPAPTLEELIEADQVLFSKDLSPLQSAAAMQTLRTHLGELRYESWESMPLLVSDHFAIGEEISGSLTIPWDFTSVQLLSFLAHNTKAVEQCKAAALALATSVEQLIAELGSALNLDDILISCSHREALHTLQLLHRNKELLHGVGLTDLTLEIQPDRFATRANGVVIVSAAGLRTYDQLKEWLELIQPKLQLQKTLYRLSRHMLETTMWHLQQFREMVEPAGLDAFHNNDHTYAQRMEWAKELFRIGPSLAQWDWSEFTFMLSPELDLDWEHRLLALPYNFDGNALLRYVEDIQRDATRRQREELLASSASGQSAAEAERERQHRQELQLSGGEDGGTAADGNSAAEGAPRVRELYRRTRPEMEEYLTSSPDRVDPLSVERPLSHAVSFNSDTEAEDQLKWEGFYQEPVVDQVPAGDLDDLNHTFRMTNRWHREAAAKQLLEQLKDQYGPRSRKFDYQKMGDVLEINNAKVQPKGFPVLTPGLRPGEA